jgi:hypothetical protein
MTPGAGLAIDYLANHRDLIPEITELIYGQYMYLSVGAAEAFYLGLGWTVLERVNSYGVKDVTVMMKHLPRA